MEDILQSQIVIMSNTDKQYLSDESLVDVDSNQSEPNPLNPWGNMNVQDIPMDIKYVPDSNSCPTSYEIEEKNGCSKPYALKFGLNIRFHIQQKLFIIKL